MCRCASGFSIQGIAAGGRIVIRVRVCVLASPVKGGFFEGSSIWNALRLCPKNEIVKTRMSKRCCEIVYFESISFFRKERI